MGFRLWVTKPVLSTTQPPQQLSIVLLVPYNRQNDTLIVSYSEDLIRRTTNFLEPVSTFLVSGQLPSLLGCTWQKTRLYKHKFKRYPHVREAVTSLTFWQKAYAVA